MHIKGETMNNITDFPVTVEEMKSAPADTYWLVKSQKRPGSPETEFPKEWYESKQLYRKSKCFHLVAHRFVSGNDVHTIDGKVSGKPDGKHSWPKKREQYFYHEHFVPNPYRVDVVSRVDKNNLDQVFEKEFKKQSL